MKKTLSMLLAGAMLATALTGCGGSASSSSDSQNSGNSDSTASGTAFKIGGTGPLTGAAAIYGNAARTAHRSRLTRSTLRAAIFSSS